MSGRRFDSRCGRDKYDNITSNRLKHLPPAPIQEVEIFDWDAKRKEWENDKTARFSGLPPVIKNFYKEDQSVCNMTKVEVDKCRLENRKITVSYKDKDECLDAPNPVRTFREAWQHFPDILELLEGRYERPSPIQMQLWPVLLSGRDAVGIAQTGTGKTLAFLLPGLVNIMNQAPEAAEYTGPRMIVLAPTRELAQQIHEEVNKLQYSKIKSVCIYGKGDRQKQLDGINGGAQVVVATPGRLDDLLRAKEVDLRRVSYAVFDEADRMLDMGFMHNLSYIITGIRADRQFIMTSATWNDNIHFIAKNYLKDEILVRVGERELEAAYTVSQEVTVCEDEEKFGLLMKFLSTCTRHDKGLVFVNKRVMCDPLSSDIRAHYDYKFTEDTLLPETLYGSMDQEAREESLDSFRKSESRLLICTDVAARGLDVLDVTFVINYDLPLSMEEYVHRSGRTGRAGRTGHVLTFVCWKDRRNVRKFIEILERSKTTVPQELRRLADRADRSNAIRNERNAAGEREGGGNFGGGDRGGSYGGGGSGRSFGGGDRGKNDGSGDSGRRYGGGNSGRSYDGGNSGRSYDGGNSGRSYDSGKSGKNYGGGNSGSSYGGGDSERNYGGGNNRKSYGGSNDDKSYGGGACGRSSNDGGRKADDSRFKNSSNTHDGNQGRAHYSAHSSQVTPTAATPNCADEAWEEDWTSTANDQQNFALPATCSTHEPSGMSAVTPAVRTDNSDPAWQQPQEHDDYSQFGGLDYSDGGAHSAYYVVQDNTGTAGQQYYPDTSTAGTYTGYQEYYDESQTYAAAAAYAPCADTTGQQQCSDGYYVQDPNTTQVAYYTDPNAAVGAQYYVDPNAVQNPATYCTDPNTAGQFQATFSDEPAAAAEGTLDYWNYSGGQIPAETEIPAHKVGSMHHLTAALANTSITAAAAGTLK